MGSVSADQSDNRLALIMHGGENFVARLKAMEDQERSLKVSYDNFNIGLDIKRAREEVETLKADAMAVVEASKAYAEDLRRKVAAEVEEIKAKALLVRDAADAYAKDKRSTADAMVANAKAEAGQLIASAKDHHDSASSKLAEASEMRANLKTAMDAAKKREAEAMSKCSEADDKLEKLTNLVALLKK